MKTTVVMSSRSVGSGASALIVISVPPGLRRAGEHLAADRVEHQVGLACRVLDALGLQRDEAVGAQLRGQRSGVATPGSDHLGACPVGKLDRR